MLGLRESVVHDVLRQKLLAEIVFFLLLCNVFKWHSICGFQLGCRSRVIFDACKLIMYCRISLLPMINTRGSCHYCKPVVFNQ